MTEHQKDIRDLLALRLIDEGYAPTDLVAILTAEPGEIEQLIAECLMDGAAEQGAKA